MKKNYQIKIVILAFGVAFSLLGAVNISSYHNSTKLIESDDKVKHTYKVLKTLSDVFVAVTEAEAIFSEYTLNPNKEALKIYNLTVEKIKIQIKMIEQLTAKVPAQQQRLIILENLLKEHIYVYQTSMETPKKNQNQLKFESYNVEKKSNSNQIRLLIGEMQRQEEKLLEKWVQQYESTIQARMLIEILGTLLSFSIFFGVYGLLFQQMLKRQKAESIQLILTQEKEISELKMRFFSMVSHEFRTPLSIILGSAQLLAETNEYGFENKKIKNLERIQSSAKLMKKLLDDILTLTRAEAGKLEYQPKEIDLEEFCLNLIEDIKLGNFSQHSINFFSQTPRRYAYLDEKLLYSILTNLLSNALKYSSKDQKVTFTISEEEKLLIFTIKDEGIGISKEEIQQIYEPFYRSIEVKHIAGTGLGLAIVKKCLAIHGGQLFIDSQLGSGTTVIAKIPQP